MNTTQSKIVKFFHDTNEHMAIIGPAGTGKSFIVQNIIKQIKVEKNYVITAMTGVAADLLPNGVTLHHALGLGNGTKNTEDIVSDIRNNGTKLKFFKELDVLFIDEISMMNSELFENIDKISKNVRNNERPFGGLRLIVLGDFLQLGPVNVRRSVKRSPYVFECDLWKDTFSKNNTFFLTQNMRQTDPKWIDLLNAVRIGNLSTHHLTKLLSMKRDKINEEDNLIHLYCTNNNVDEYNIKKCNELIKKGAKSKIFESKISRMEYTNLKKPDVHLCVGARVMHTVNEPARSIFNGSVGTVLEINEDSKKGDSVRVRFDSNGSILTICFVKKDITYHQNKSVVVTFLPLKLCWATTIHKAQGATLHGAYLILNNAFAPNQVYTALSRFVSSENVYLLGFDPKKVVACPTCLGYYEYHGMLHL